MGESMSGAWRPSWVVVLLAASNATSHEVKGSTHRIEAESTSR